MPTTKTTNAGGEALKQVHYLAGALKAPRITEAAARLADHARDSSWTHEEYLAAVLDREVAARNASGAQLRIRAAGFGARKTLEEFAWEAQPAVRQQVAALASGGFLTEARNVVLLGPPGTGKTHLATGLGIAAAHHGHRVLFATATDWVTRLTDAHRAHKLPAELARLRRYALIIVDEVGYLPFEQDAANLFFQLVSSRYEHASLILTSNLRFPPNRGGLLLGRGRLVGGQVLIGDGAQHLGAAMPSAVVVELIAPGQHDAAGVVGVGQLVARQDFPFQAGEERLGGSIVETRSDPAHGLTNA